MPTFDTPRLHLRPLDASDEALYCRLYCDPDVMRHIGTPLSPEAARAAFATVIGLMRRDAPTMQVWVMRDRAFGADVGILALIRHADMPDAREIGAMLLVEGQGRGFAVEAQTALLDWVFDAQGVRTVWSRNAPGNAAAAGVRLKLGFVRAPDGPGEGGEVRWQMSRERWHAARLARGGKA